MAKYIDISKEIETVEKYNNSNIKVTFISDKLTKGLLHFLININEKESIIYTDLYGNGVIPLRNVISLMSPKDLINGDKFKFAPSSLRGSVDQVYVCVVLHAALELVHKGNKVMENMVTDRLFMQLDSDGKLKRYDKGCIFKDYDEVLLVNDK